MRTLVAFFSYGTSERTRREELGDWQLWTEAGKLPISTMSLKWLNLNFDKGGAAKKEEEATAATTTERQE